jgi:hypothetical protein
MKKYFLGLLFALATCTPPSPPVSPTGTLSPEPSSTIQTVTASPTPSTTPTLVFPSATPVDSVRFAVIGDYGQAGEYLAAVAGIVKGWEPDIILTVGDNNYPDGEASTIDDNIGQYFHEYIYPYTGEYGEGATLNRFFPTIGNHDWNTPGAQPYQDYFTLPGNGRYYDFVWGPVHFFAIDSDSREPDGIGRSSAQAAWLRASLAESSAQWKVVYMHHPPYSSALHGSERALQWPYQGWGASAVISGHDHVYERILVDSFPYFVNGLGGSSNRYGFILPIPGSQARYRAMHGAMLVAATTSQITFQFVNVLGEVIDTYTMQAE